MDLTNTDDDLVVHPPIEMRRIGAGPAVAEVPPEMCDGGHQLQRPILVGWYPCVCGGHRTYSCACGVMSHYRSLDEPLGPCQPAHAVWPGATVNRP